MDRANKSVMMEIKLTLTQYATHSFMFEQFSGIQLFIYVKSVLYTSLTYLIWLNKLN